MAIETAEQFFIDELKSIYSAEKQAVRLYPKLAKAVESEPLKEALQTHLEETKGQVERLDRAFEILGKRAAGKICEGMKGLLTEVQEVIEKLSEGPLRDAGLIAAVQRSEHYEIAAYGTIVALAKAMGQDEIGSLLGATLDEEKNTDKKLNAVSKSVNKQALANSEPEIEEDGEEESEEATASSGRKTRKTAKR